MSQLRVLRHPGNRVDLKTLISEVDQHQVLVSIAAHDQLALRSVNRDGLHLGDKAQGPFEGGDAALIMQAPNF